MHYPYFPCIIYYDFFYPYKKIILLIIGHFVVGLIIDSYLQR